MRKAQLEIMQTVFILLFVFMILAIAGIFVIGIQTNNQRNSLNDQNAVFSVKKSTSFNYMPELQCSFDSVITQDCFDIVKMEHFPEIAEENEEYYKGMLGFVNISVREFSEGMPGREYQLYSNSREDYREMNTIKIPVMLYDPVEDSTSFGEVKIDVFI